MSLKFISAFAPTQNQLRTVQIMVPIIIYVLHRRLIGVETQTHHETIAVVEPITHAGRNLFGVIVILEIEQRIFLGVLGVLVADERRRSVIKFLQQVGAVIKAVDGGLIGTLLCDGVTGADCPHPTMEHDRIARQTYFILLMSTRN